MRLRVDSSVCCCLIYVSFFCWNWVCLLQRRDFRYRFFSFLGSSSDYLWSNSFRFLLWSYLLVIFCKILNLYDIGWTLPCLKTCPRLGRFVVARDFCRTCRDCCFWLLTASAAACRNESSDGVSWRRARVAVRSGRIDLVR